MSSWPLYPFFCYSLLLLGILSVSRILLLAWKYERVSSFQNALKILVYGLRFDIITICYLWMFPALLLVLLPQTEWLNNTIVLLTGLWFAITTLLVVFMEISTPAFIDQFDTRPNRLFFEYLETPVEVIKTSLLEYPWHFVAAAIVLGLLGYFLIGFDTLIYSNITPWIWWQRLLLFPVVFITLVIGARSSFAHRPANASMAAFSNDQLVNKLGLNSTYTVLDALFTLKNEEIDNSTYGRMEDAEVVRIIRENSRIDPALFVEDRLSTWHKQAIKTTKPPANLVIILEESLGAGYSAKLGGLGVTPELDSLSEEGLWLSNLYATGTRSARGIEAVISGFPPSPSRSVLKLGMAQQHFPTIASVLKQHDYDSQFIYGGESHFDNMAAFFLANGFDKVTDTKDYPDPVFRGTWGVSDEDLFIKLDEELVNASGKPQFILAFTSSSHGPYEFPDGRIELFDENKHTENNAIKYADFALGQFFRTAKTRDYWDNTYFLIVSDHDTRIYGAALVPVKKFHIPALIIGPDVQPQEYSTLCSQIDLAPTLLSLMGIQNSNPMIGYDLLQLPSDYPGRAMMQYEDNHAFIFGEDVVVHRPDKDPKQFIYADKQLHERVLDEKLSHIAKAHALWPMFAYREKKYLYQ